MTIKERLIEVLSCETSVLDPDDAEPLAETILTQMPEIIDAFDACRSVTENWTTNLTAAANLCQRSADVFDPEP